MIRQLLITLEGTHGDLEGAQDAITDACHHIESMKWSDGGAIEIDVDSAEGYKWKTW